MRSLNSSDRHSCKAGHADAYFVELALRHELMHAEAFHYTRQTLGYPAPDAAFERLHGR